MGNWSLTGILLTVGVFLGLVAFLMAMIQVTNPLTGYEQNIWSWLFSLIT